MRTEFNILPKRSVVERDHMGKAYMMEVPRQVILVSDEANVKIHHIGDQYHITVDLPEGYPND